MKIVNEIDLNPEIGELIKQLRNASFPDHISPNSFFKQIPHFRCLQYDGHELVGYMGLDYRVMSAGSHQYKVLGVIDICVSHNKRGQGVGSQMVLELSEYASRKDVDFIVLVSGENRFFERNGFTKRTVPSSWLRLHEYRNYGVSFEYLNNFFTKPTGNKQWSEGHVDWLGYMF